jgi:hypothetical protein
MTKNLLVHDPYGSKTYDLSRNFGGSTKEIPKPALMKQLVLIRNKKARKIVAMGWEKSGRVGAVFHEPKNVFWMSQGWL